MNRLLGEKLSIVSPKPQTTRLCIRGFYNTPAGQIIFLDTPGFLEARYSLHEKMLEYLEQSIKWSDVVLFMTDIREFLTDYDQILLEKLQQSKKQVICAINKVDLCDTPTDIDEKVNLLKQSFSRVFTISALKDEGFSTLIEALWEQLPAHPPLYNTDDLSDMPMRFFASEIIREKIFLLCEQEIPYCSTVVVEKWTESEDSDTIIANIWVEKESQKAIIIGKKGEMIGNIRKAASEDIRKLTDRRVVLNLWVKVKHDWRKKVGALREFGY